MNTGIINVARYYLRSPHLAALALYVLYLVLLSLVGLVLLLLLLCGWLCARPLLVPLVPVLGAVATLHSVPLALGPAPRPRVPASRQRSIFLNDNGIINKN